MKRCLQFLFGVMLSLSAFSQSITYTYDSLNRLVRADYGGGIEITYGYDAAGNRLSYSDVDVTPYVDTKVTLWDQTAGAPVPMPTDLNTVVALAAGLHSLALRADGTVVGWGHQEDSNDLDVPPGLSNVIAVAAGYSHSLALRADGTVLAWGVNF